MKNNSIKKKIITGISLCLTGLLLHTSTPFKVPGNFVDYNNQTVSTAAYDIPNADYIKGKN